MLIAAFANKLPPLVVRHLVRRHVASNMYGHEVPHRGTVSAALDPKEGSPVRDEASRRG
jgi:hypothetical protein